MEDTKNNRALKKTIITVAIIAVVIAIANVWPPILGYIAIGIFVSMFVGAIYAAFSMYEDSKERNKRK